MNFSSSVFAVWQRHFFVFRKDLAYGVVTTFVEPLLYLFSFGFGLGGMINSVTIGGVSLSYRAFVLAGIAGQSIFFTAFFDGAYGGFVRMYYQKIFQAISVTPVTLSEVLWGELLWCCTRAMMPAVVVLAIGVVIGDFGFFGSLAVLPIALVAALCFAALGMLSAAMATSIESIGYPQFLFVFPMFLFCGVFFPLSQLPSWAQLFAYFLPLTAQLSLTRTLVLGTPFEWWAPINLLVWTLALVVFARRLMRRRLVF